MLILFPDNDRKMFHNGISQLLWKTLWRMWKTPGYSQVFWLFGNTGLWRKENGFRAENGASRETGER